ncbi:MAG: 16S rRNA (cytosine(967)-C(5))-methyltransferase RsmB [Lachnospiraceae bacterium]
MGSSVNDRELVLETLLLITKEGEYSHIALKNVLDQYQYLDKKERAFITRVVNGTLERMIEIDHIINQFSKVKVNKMKPVIRTTLRSSVYQLKYMDSVPDSAVCNEAVKLAVRKGFSNLKGFVNGVLRTISRNLESVELTSLSVKYSLPQWIVDQWLESYDEDTVARMGQAFLEEHPTTIRCNLNAVSIEALTKELREEQVEVEETSFPYALHIHGYDYLNKLTSFQKGHFYVQDISSMQVAEWADPKEGDYVIDVCAAPGGKAIHMAEKLAGSGHVEARDLTEYKAGLINENIQRSRLDNIEAVCHDATVYDEAAKDKADIVIADLPCSGLGVLGKKVDLKYKMTEDMQRDLAGLQRKILSVVHTYVKPGGKLVYSTCTIHRGENEDNARWFEETYPQFRLVKEQQFLPGREEGDGFYIALFERERHG